MERYLCKFNEKGERIESRGLHVGFDTQEEYDALIAQGFEPTSDEDYNKLLGNFDGQEYIKVDGVLKPKPPYAPSETELQNQAYSLVDSHTAKAITGGFVSSCTGESVRYDSDQDTQVTMQGIALNAISEEFTTKYPAGCPVRGYKNEETTKTIQFLNGEQVLKWCADLSTHIGSCKQAGWELQALVPNIKTQKDLDDFISKNLT